MSQEEVEQIRGAGKAVGIEIKKRGMEVQGQLQWNAIGRLKYNRRYRGI